VAFAIAGVEYLYDYYYPTKNEPATILFDYLPDENTIGEVLWFGRNLMSSYASLLPILFLSIVVICL
jgi:hypothetical protein